jgi:hypothetical protein
VPHLSAAAWDDPDVTALTTAQQVELRTRYGGDSEPGVRPPAADVAVVLLVRDDDGTAVGCGALRRLGPVAAELKRMYVVPAARGRIDAFGSYVREDQDWSLYFERTLA